MNHWCRDCNLKILSCSHLLSELGKPVGDEEGCVHEPIHAVGYVGLCLYCTVLYCTVPVVGQQPVELCLHVCGLGDHRRHVAVTGHQPRQLAAENMCLIYKYFFLIVFILHCRLILLQKLFLCVYHSPGVWYDHLISKPEKMGCNFIGINERILHLPIVS